MKIRGSGTTGKESGAALPMVLMMTFLLGTAVVALLSAAGSSQRDATDVLSETKAYYSAESGIQATVEALRFKGVDGGPLDYKAAVNNFANSSNMATWLTYFDCDPTGGVDLRVRVSESCENAYSVHVRDPDNSQSGLTYRTINAQFRAQNSDGTFQSWGPPTRTFVAGLATTTLTWIPNPTNPTTLAFSEGAPTVTSLIGTLRLTNGADGGTVMDTATEFQVYYQLDIPGNPGWMILGKVATNGTVTLVSAKYIITGSQITLCGDNITCPQQNGTPFVPPAGAGAVRDFVFNGVITPKEPHRLVLTSTGYGPNGASKKLEAVIQKSPLDGMNSVSPFTMLGPCSETGNPSNTAVFDAGTSATTTYTGSSAGGVNMPAFAFNQQCNLTTAEAYIKLKLTPTAPNKPPQVSPPPAYFPDAYLPEWQRSPQLMESKLNEYRAQAQYTQTYYNPAGGNIRDPNYVTGMTTNPKGVTFCEGDCTVDGNQGGGVLVVTGTLRSLGGFGFKGLIIVTGPGGWERQGGGCGEIIGNVVISPYTAADLVTDVFRLPPKYQITGAGCSGVEYAALDDLLQGENEAFTNVVRGVAEK
jgi:hypothetical protein